MVLAKKGETKNPIKRKRVYYVSISFFNYWAEELKLTSVEPALRTSGVVYCSRSLFGSLQELNSLWVGAAGHHQERNMN